MIFSFDTELRIFELSPSAEMVTGHRREDILGKPFYELNILHPDYIELGMEDAKSVLSGSVGCFSIRNRPSGWMSHGRPS